MSARRDVAFSWLLQKALYPLHMKAWIQAGFALVVSMVPCHFLGGTGAAKRSGGDAKGIPRNLFTVTVEEGRMVVVPMMIPESNVADGLSAFVEVQRTKIGISRRRRMIFETLLQREREVFDNCDCHVFCPWNLSVDLITNQCNYTWDINGKMFRPNSYFVESEYVTVGSHEADF